MRYVTHLGELTHLSFPLRTNSILTPCKQGAVLSRYSPFPFNENELLTPNSHLPPLPSKKVLAINGADAKDVADHETEGYDDGRDGEGADRAKNEVPVEIRLKLLGARAQSSPRNITHREGSLLQIAANRCLWGCCEMLMRFGFRLEMLYLSSIKPNTISSLRVTKIRKSVSLYGIFIRHSP